MILFKVISLASLVAFGSCQDYQDFQNIGRQAPHRLSSQQETANKPTPVPILKQINRHNEDGSYTYGYEGADGSFKIETKLATGEVKGKYGYVDETGKTRIVEYGANKYGFQPAGEGITVAPPTLVDDTTDKNGRRIPDYEEEEQQAPVPQSKYRPQQKAHRPAPPPQQYYEYEQVQERPRHQQQSAGPAPPRLQIPGAAPVQQNLDVVYAPRPRPARIEPDYEDVGPQTFPQAGPQQGRHAVPSQLFTNIAPSRPKAPKQYQPQPQQYQEPQQQQYQQQQPQQVQYQQQQQQSAHQPGSSSLLDQLAKDYALPQGGSQALHDISFGYF